MLDSTTFTNILFPSSLNGRNGELAPQPLAHTPALPEGMDYSSSPSPEPSIVLYIDVLGVELHSENGRRGWTRTNDGFVMRADLQSAAVAAVPPGV